MSRKGDGECDKIWGWCYNALKSYAMMLDGAIGMSQWLVSSLIFASYKKVARIEQDMT